MMYPTSTVLSENIQILDSLVLSIPMLHTRSLGYLCTSWESESNFKM